MDDLIKNLRALSACHYVNGPRVHGSKVCTDAAQALEAAKRENAELRAALEEVRDSKVCWDWGNDEVAHWTEVDGNTDSFVAPQFAAWLRQQEVQG